VRIISRIGILVALAGTALIAIFLYQVLHLETCVTHTALGSEGSCAKPITSEVGLITIGAPITFAGFFVSFELAFWWLFPAFWVILGSSALVAGLTSHPTGVTVNVSRSVGIELGAIFIGVGLLLLLLFSLLIRPGRRRSATGPPPLNVPPVPPLAPASNASPLTQLEQLEALRRRGAISDSEFEAAKAQLLGGI
jgi:hypothetical protein